MIRIRFSTIYTYFYENLSSKKLKFKINNRLNHTVLVALRIYVTIPLNICCNVVARKKKRNNKLSVLFLRSRSSSNNFEELLNVMDCWCTIICQDVCISGAREYERALYRSGCSFEGAWLVSPDHNSIDFFLKWRGNDHENGVKSPCKSRKLPLLRWRDAY